MGLRDDAKIIWANGETQAMLDHGKAIKDQRPDTSRDDVWTPDPKLGCQDAYVKVTSYFVLSLKMAFFFLFAFVGFMPVMFLASRHGHSMASGTEHVNRKSCAFRCFRITAALVMLPVSLVWVFSWLVDGLLYYLFSVPYCLLSCGGCRRYCESLKAIAPYQGGPGFVLDDFLVCLIGQTRRNRGCCELALSTSIMILTVPWLKYYVLCNPWLYPLQERFVQQISTSLADLGEEGAVNAARTIISRTAQEDAQTDRLDHWEFLPHYPYPPPGRRWAMGMQHLNKVSYMTHSTHWDVSLDAASDAERLHHTTGSQGHAAPADVDMEALSRGDALVLSNSCQRLIWRVMLWYSNRYHLCTGWVEASVSTGKSSQTDKKGGLEHPMWLVTAPSPALTRRDHWTGAPGRIDAFFDKWLVVLVDECRAMVRGVAIAKELHQEVHSKDGVSRPRAEIGYDELVKAPKWNPTLHRED